MPGTSSADHLQGLPETIVSLRKSYEEGYVSRRHSHTRYQIMFATTGLMLAETEGVNWAVPAGYALIIPPDTPHQTRMIGEVRLRSIYISPDAFEAASSPECRVVALSELLSALVQRLCLLDNQDDGTERGHHLTQLILLELRDTPNAPLALPCPQSAKLGQVCGALLADPSIPKTIDHWAAECGMSRRTFTRAFRRDTGLSFDAWRQRLRCQAAHRLLAEGESLPRIAPKVGYNSPYALKSLMRKLR